MKNISLVIILLVIHQTSYAQKINPDNISIVRDSFGVPHIFAEKNSEVAYGLGWVQCEDQFKTMQEILAACRGLLGEINGKDGVIADIGIQYMGIADFVKEHYEADVTGAFKIYLEGFVSGVNDYASKHPERVILKKLFPITGEDVITGYLLGNVEISGAGKDLQRILNGKISRDMPKGSNAIAISSKKTTDGKTYLAINSHQPLEGWYSWYEAHLMSNEGLNIIGGTFAGGASIFLGANEHLGWAHTVNHADFSDVYELTMNTDKSMYLMDNRWIPLIKKKAKAKMKILGFLKIPVTTTYYESVYGPTFKTDDGYFAWRFMAGQTLKMAEQWWKMNLATNLEEFKEALEIRGIVSTNIVYADNEDNIFYVSNGTIPQRDIEYEWDKVLPGNTSKTMTDINNLIPFDSLPQVLNPESGWVFNTNNTPFTASSQNDTPKETILNEVMGFQSTGRENNRSARFLELIESYEKLSYDDFKRIKYDNQYPSQFRKVRGLDVNVLFRMKASDYPDISDAIRIIQEWDRKTDIDNKSASMFLATIYEMNELSSKSLQREELAAAGIRKAKKLMLSEFGGMQIPLGNFQRHSRGNVNFPMAGGPDVLAAIYCQRQKDGTYRALGGDSYIQMVRFSSEGVEIESINAFGSSEVLENPNSTSQMEYFATQRLKKMTFDKEEIIQNAVRIYAPK